MRRCRVADCTCTALRCGHRMCLKHHREGRWGPSFARAFMVASLRSQGLRGDMLDSAALTLQALFPTLAGADRPNPPNVREPVVRMRGLRADAIVIDDPLLEEVAGRDGE